MSGLAADVQGPRDVAVRPAAGEGPRRLLTFELLQLVAQEAEDAERRLAIHRARGLLREAAEPLSRDRYDRFQPTPHSWMHGHL